MKKALLLLAVVALVVPLSAGAAPSKAHGTSDPVACGDDGTISWTPTTLWPPNHKLHDITVTYTDPDGGTSTITLTTTDHSDMVDGEEINGSGNTDSATDSAPGAAVGEEGEPAVATVQARAERSGHSKDSGRTYTFHYVATNDGGTPEDPSDDDGCNSMNEGQAPVTVNVPHDCRNGACKP